MKCTTLLGLLSLSGCAMVPVTSTTQTIVESRVDKRVAGTRGPLRIAVETDQARVQVRATYARICTEHFTSIVEHREHTDADLKVADLDGNIGDPRALVVVAPIALGVFLVSSVVTIGVVAVKRDKAERVEVPGRRSYACSVKGADLSILMSLPSGSQLEALTDAAGSTSFIIPDNEPDHGTVVVRASGVSPLSAMYRRQRAGVRAQPPGVQPASAFRDADPEDRPPGSAFHAADLQAGPPGMHAPSVAPSARSEAPPVAPREGFRGVLRAARSCGRQFGLSGVARVRLKIANGKPASVSTNTGGARFGGCIAQEIASVTFPDTQGGVVEIPIQLR